MKILFATLALFLMTPLLALAQDAHYQSQGEGYIVIAPIVSKLELQRE
jgi:hypothetical protein